MFLAFFPEASLFSIQRSVSEFWYRDCYSRDLAAGGRALSQRCLTDQCVENIIVRTAVSFVFEHLPLCELIFPCWFFFFINVIVTHLVFIKTMFVMSFLQLSENYFEHPFCKKKNNHNLILQTQVLFSPLYYFTF